MEKWAERFFAINKEIEVEIPDRSIDHMIQAAKELDWMFNDEFWAPDLQVSRFVRNESEIFIIQETYFGPKITGEKSDVQELSDRVSKIDPDKELYAG